MIIFKNFNKNLFKMKLYEKIGALHLLKTLLNKNCLSIIEPMKKTWKITLFSHKTRQSNITKLLR